MLGSQSEINQSAPLRTNIAELPNKMATGPNFKEDEEDLITDSFRRWNTHGGRRLVGGEAIATRGRIFHPPP